MNLDQRVVGSDASVMQLSLVGGIITVVSTILAMERNRGLDVLERLESLVVLAQEFAISARRSVRPLYGYGRLRTVEATVNGCENQRLIFANSPNAVDRNLAKAILSEAERRTNLPTNAVTTRNPRTGEMTVVFRNRNVTRAEVLEELRHLQQPSLGLWNVELPGLSAFQVREIDVAVYFRNLLQEGSINQAEFDETIKNLAHHLNTTEEEAFRIVERLAQ